jgi:thymidylate kinase
MIIENTIEFVKEEIKKYGVRDDVKKYYVFRNNTKPQAFEEGSAYFGFIHPDEETTGAYHDFCIVLFPGDKTGGNKWVLSLGVGSLGFLNDYELSTRPGLRRLYQSIISSEGFCKTDFSDLEQSLPRDFVDKVPHLKTTLKRYTKVLPVCEILDDIESEKSKEKISAFLAIYAKARGWLSNNSHRANYQTALRKFQRIEVINNEKEAVSLILKRKFVILTGAPGVGKTRLAKIIGGKINAHTFFTQFHAETDYSDFIYGIIPNLSANGLGYKQKNGVFQESLQFAVNNPQQNTLLIVDEINRANLANILGPIFYLFEYRMDENEATEEIDISPDFSISKIPSNLYMIGTMNTADRSLAVVDFALRRRFAWYDLKPSPIDNECFYLDDFQAISNVFQWYANSDELNLQPGQGYFLANSEEDFLSRVEYELLPLVREYLQEQLLLPAKEELNNYFLSRISKPIFE